MTAKYETGDERALSFRLSMVLSLDAALQWGKMPLTKSLTASPKPNQNTDQFIQYQYTVTDLLFGTVWKKQWPQIFPNQF